MTTSLLMTRCPACSAKNRLPIAKIGAPGKCGRCAEALATRDFFADAPVEVDEGRFDLLARSGSRPVLVDFWAGWCAPRRELAPVLEQLARELESRLLVVKVDTEGAPMLAARHAIQSVPTLVLMRSGIEVDRVMGALPLLAQRALGQPIDSHPQVSGLHRHASCTQLRGFELRGLSSPLAIRLPSPYHSWRVSPAKARKAMRVSATSGRQPVRASARASSCGQQRTPPDC